MSAKKQSRRKFMGKLSASLIGLGLFGQAAAAGFIRTGSRLFPVVNSQCTI